MMNLSSLFTSTKRAFFDGLLASIVALMFLLIGGCGSKNDAVSQAEKQDAINGIPVPSLAETKAIAQEGFVFGLPIVMYYTSAYELFVDPTSSQYKAPVGQLFNEARVFTPQDTAVITPNSDTPYSMMEIDLRAEPTVVSVPAVPKPRYYSVQLTDANTFNYGYIGSRTTGTGPGDYMILDLIGKARRLLTLNKSSTQPRHFQRCFFAHSYSMRWICRMSSRFRQDTKFNHSPSI